MTTGPNTYQLRLKIVFLLMIFFIAGGMIIMHPKFHYGKLDPVIGKFFLGFTLLLLLWALLVIILQVLVLPKGVTTDEPKKTITLYYFTAAPLELDVFELDSYCNFRTSSRSSAYPGILLKIKSGRKYVLSNLNLQDYLPVKTFLDASAVPCTGQKSIFDFSIYFFRYLKR